MIKNQLKLIIIILIFISNVNFAFSEANETPTFNQKTTTINCVSFIENEAVTQQNVLINYKEIEIILELFDNLIKKFEESKNTDELQQTLNKYVTQLGFFEINHPVLNWILKSINNYKLPRTKTFVISHGRGIRLNPLKNHQINLYRPLTIWHYSNKNEIEIPAKTLLFRPITYNLKVLNGNQFGIMSYFTGLYIYISQPPPQKSYTFFIGSTNRINGIDFSNINQVSEYITLALILGVFTATPIILNSTFSLLKNRLNVTEIQNKKNPIADFYFYPINPFILEEIQFYDKSKSSISKITSWIWDFGDGNISNIQNPKHMYKQTGSYTIKLEILDTNGNSDSTSKTINIEKKLEKHTKNKNNDIGQENIGLNIFLLLLSTILVIMLIFIFKYYK
jgi:PKD repeat protein